MSSDIQEAPIVELGRWFETPPGRKALQWELAQLDAAVADAFGFHAVQVGLPMLEGLRANRVPTRVFAGEPIEADTARARWPVVCAVEPETLPFANQSLDLLVLPHTLDSAADPHQVLREAERVLMPEGRLVITGFNPWSLWGMPDRLGWRTPFLPAGIAPVSLARLKDWLKLLSFDVDRGRFGAYVPACRTDKWLARFAFMEKAGDRWWPVCGGLYAVSAVKRTAGMTLVGPAWKRRQARQGVRVVATPTARTGSPPDPT